MRSSKIRKRITICFVISVILTAALSAQKKSNDQPYYKRGVQLFDKGSYEASIPYFIKAKKLNPKFAMTYYFLAVCFDRHRFQYKTAVNHYKAFLYAHNKSDAIAQKAKTRLREIGTLKLIQDKKGKWRTPNRKTHEAHQTARRLCRTAAQKLKDRQDQSALDLCRQALQKVPYFEAAYYLGGVAAFNVKNYELAYRYFLEASTLNDKNAQTFYFLGVLADQYKQDLSIARGFYRDYLRSDEKDKRSEVMAHLDRIDRFEKNYAQGINAYKRSDYQAALQYFKKALRIHNANARAHTAMGMTCQKLKNNDAAGKAFKNALALKPDDPILYYNMASYYVSVNEDAKARAVLEKGKPYYELESKMVILGDKKFVGKMGKAYLDNILKDAK